MTSTPSTILRLELLGNGDQPGTWGTTTNTNLGTLLEGAIAGWVSVSVTSADQALSIVNYAPDQARRAMLTLTTTTAANFNVYAPPVSKQYIIYNNSSYTATIFNGTAGSPTGSGIAIPAGKIMTVWSDGTNFYKANTATSLTTDVSGTLPVANGGTGATTLTGVLRGNGTSAFTAGSVSLTSEVTGTLPVANGGTGVTSSTGSGSNVLSSGASVSNFSVSNGLTVTSNAQTTPSSLAYAASITLSCGSSNVFTTTLTGNITSTTLSGPSNGQTINWFLIQDGSGNRTITWPGTVKWAAGSPTALSTTANAVDLFVATYLSSTGFWYASLMRNFS